MSDPETVAEVIGGEVTAAIENTVAEVEANAEHAAEVNALLVEAAIEGERSERIHALERRFDEWQSNQADQSEAIASLTLGLTQLSGQMSVLIQQQSPTPNPPSVADGPKENQEETPLPAPVVAEAPEPAPPPPPAPKRKKRSWI